MPLFSSRLWKKARPCRLDLKVAAEAHSHCTRDPLSAHPGFAGLRGVKALDV